MTTHELLLQKQYFMKTHEKVIQDLQTRQLLGVQKYGVTVDDAKLTETDLNATMLQKTNCKTIKNNI